MMYVINLKRRPDRLQAMHRAMPDAWLERAQFTTDWPGPVDGSQINAQMLEDAGLSLFPWQLADSDNSWWSRPLKRGEIGCSYSHLSVWRDAALKFAESLHGAVLIFEDDVTFADDAVERFESEIETLPDDWDLVYLGRVPLERELEQRQGQWVRPRFSYCTFGYALSRQGVKKLLDAHLERNLIPVDEFLAACYAPHPRADVRHRYPPVLNAYAFEPHLVKQRTKNDAGSDTESSAFV